MFVLIPIRGRIERDHCLMLSFCSENMVVPQHLLENLFVFINILAYHCMLLTERIEMQC